MLWQCRWYDFTTKIQVKFEDEDGSGPGNNWGFFAALATAIKSSDQAPSPITYLFTVFL